MKTATPAQHTCKEGQCDHKWQCVCSECRPQYTQTPPWKVVENEVGWLSNIAEEKWLGSGIGIGYCDGTMLQAEANAALIVRAVNRDHLFEELVGSLKAEHEHFIVTTYKDVKTHSRKDCRYCCLIAKSEAAR